MRSLVGWPCLGTVGIFITLLGPVARAAEAPLLVVVEAPSSLDADAAEIRRAIGSELGTETIAPLKTPADPPERVLIVALDRERIAMSLRTNDAAPIVRTIPAPSEHAARLRAIAWLAGNLARDQVNPLLATLPDAPPAPAASTATNTSPPSPPASQSFEPPPFEPTVGTVAAHFDPTPPRRSPWTLGAAAGPAISLYETVHSLRQSIFGSWNASSAEGEVANSATTVWRVELRRRADGSHLFTGLALEGSSINYNSIDFEIIGAAGFVGSARQLGRWSMETTLGAGIDLGEQAIQTGTYSAGTGFTSAISGAIRPSLYATARLTAAHPLFESVAVLLSIDAHVSVIDEFDNYLASMLGLRYNL
jgi:hypothetical protein